ncbi:hypothetical protein TSOC_005086 [Tetrabaena socialis]|uniref:RING-type domain-containing protein n=1 Tax=Tetrabaena socialis TaxID=47790 RepID=A0A2J8A7A6_9CHLO|nr:hypothetical protein TSOC_005086 [Tetrabaena socialis]|eukprot:PNH08385.1 hypothetical protein TSOC_005086 [Tetrabaena socialis]
MFRPLRDHLASWPTKKLLQLTKALVELALEPCSRDATRPYRAVSSRSFVAGGVLWQLSAEPRPARAQAPGGLPRSEVGGETVSEPSHQLLLKASLAASHWRAGEAVALRGRLELEGGGEEAFEAVLSSGSPSVSIDRGLEGTAMPYGSQVVRLYLYDMTAVWLPDSGHVEARYERISRQHARTAATAAALGVGPLMQRAAAVEVAVAADGSGALALNYVYNGLSTTDTMRVTRAAPSPASPRASPAAAPPAAVAAAAAASPHHSDEAPARRELAARLAQSARRRRQGRRGAASDMAGPLPVQRIPSLDAQPGGDQGDGSGRGAAAWGRAAAAAAVAAEGAKRAGGCGGGRGGGSGEESCCLVCLDAPRQHGFLHGDTMHVGVCGECAARLAAAAKGAGGRLCCPVCREQVERTVAVFQ